MTDRQSDTDHDIENMGHDDIYAMPEGGDAEAWQGDLPPADDFHDELTDGAPYQEESGAEPVAVQSAQDEAKKRGRMVLFAMVGVIAVFGGGIAYMNMSQKPSLPNAVPATAIFGGDVLKPRATTEEAAKNEPEMVSPRTGETDLASLYGRSNDAMTGSAVALPTGQNDGAPKPADKADIAAKQQPTVSSGMFDQPATGSVSAPSSSSVGQTLSSVPETSSVQAGAVIQKTDAKDQSMIESLVGGGSSVEAVASIPAVPSAPSTPSASSVLAEPSAAVPPVSTAPAAAAPSSAEAERRMQEMTAEIASLKASLDQALKNTTELTQKLDAATMAERAARMEADASSKKSTTKPAAIAVHDPMMDDMTSMAPAPKKTAAVQSKRPTVRKSVAKAPSKARHGWTLRAATPDAAWVSKSNEGADLERVYVGDVLEGIGTVKAIRQKGDVWEVVGSKGSIR